MRSTSAVIYCLAYIVGLLISGIHFGGAIAVVGSVIAAGLIPRWKSGFTNRLTWVIAGAIALFAGFYLQLRTPQPSPHDISRLISETSKEVTVQGRVEELPRLTRSGRLQVWLSVTHLTSTNQKVGGKLYVTLTQKDGRDLYPGQAIALTGSLYKPKPAMNPGGFDFQKYLAQEGAFAGMQGQSIQQLEPTQHPQWGVWMIPQKIARSHLAQLGSSEGALVSAMVLGNRVVDIPFEIKDAFARIGLSHALAASGFQVSLILSIVLLLTRRLPKGIQIGCGAIGLILFVGLTGMQPAVMRAVFMGFAVLFGLALDRKIKPLATLLLVAVILLVINPIWIWNLGFQFSFLATLGLLVTVPALTKRLDWLPTIIVPTIAVPIAAFLWTLPLQLYQFGLVSPYSILVNIIATPLISLISIGGIVSAAINLASPTLGNFVTPILYFPSHWLIESVKWVCQLPGNSIAVGTISIGLMIVLYGLICLPWGIPKYHRQWWILLLTGIACVFLPIAFFRTNLLQVTALSVGRDEILVIQHQGRVGLINSGDVNTVKFSVLPFLMREGINQIDWAIAAEPSEGWQSILERTPIRSLYEVATPEKRTVDSQTIQSLTRQQGKHHGLIAGETMKLGAIALRPLSINPTIIQIQINQQRWLWLKDVPNVQQRKAIPNSDLMNHQVLWWSGRRLHPKLLEILQPKTAIASANRINPDTLKQLQQQRIQIYQTAEDGALQWTPQRGFQTTLANNFESR
jgi:competence protein ComEC